MLWDLHSDPIFIIKVVRFRSARRRRRRRKDSQEDEEKEEGQSGGWGGGEEMTLQSARPTVLLFRDAVWNVLVGMLSHYVQHWSTCVFLPVEVGSYMMNLLYLLHSHQFCCCSIFCSLLSLFVHLTPENWAWPANQRHGNMTPSREVVAMAALSSLSVLGSIGRYYSQECQLFGGSTVWKWISTHWCHRIPQLHF